MTCLGEFWILKVWFDKKINNLFTKKIEQGFGPNSQEVDCVGETPEQDENPGDNCFSARGECL